MLRAGLVWIYFFSSGVVRFDFLFLGQGLVRFLCSSSGVWLNFLFFSLGLVRFFCFSVFAQGIGLFFPSCLVRSRLGLGFFLFKFGYA